jgi:hypothetical protein
VRVTVVHYEAAEAAALAERLRRDGLDAEPYRHLGARGFRELRANPPDAIVIDLMRMPSYGRAIGALLRESKSTRSIPLVFLEGDPAKTARVRELLPDAGFAPLARLADAARRAVRRPPADPVLPVSGTSLLEKLRIREGTSVALIGAPEGFDATLTPLPSGARFAPPGEGDVVLLFARSSAGLERSLPRFAALPKGRALWVLWPKRAARAAGDLSLPKIQNACAPLGLVAYKTCSVDRTWSAAAVSRRRS